MKRGTMLCLVAVVAVAAAILPIPASASPPQDVTIEIVLTPGPTQGGTWTSSGAISDFGSWGFDSFSLRAGTSPTVGVLRADISFDGNSGDFTLRTQGVFRIDFPNLAIEGNWVVFGGEGEYAGLLGEGSVSISVNLITEAGTGIVTGGMHFH